MPWFLSTSLQHQFERNWRLDAEWKCDCSELWGFSSGRQIHRMVFNPSESHPATHTYFPGHLESSLPWKSISCEAERLGSSVLLPWKTSITAAHRLTAAICEETGCDGRCDGRNRSIFTFSWHVTQLQLSPSVSQGECKNRSRDDSLISALAQSWQAALLNITNPNRKVSMILFFYSFSFLSTTLPFLITFSEFPLLDTLRDLI